VRVPATTGSAAGRVDAVALANGFG
jgi:hypothetical protein